MLLSKHNLAIKSFCSKTSEKPEISGIFISPKESAATDGFRLVKVSTIKNLDKEYPEIPNKKLLENFKPFILPKEKAEEVIKIFNPEKTGPLPVLKYAGVFKSNEKEAEIGTTDLESFRSVNARIINAHFPDYQQLFNENGKYVEIKVNAEFLKEIASFFASFTGKLKEVVLKVPLEKEKAIKFYGENQTDNQTAEALLMPIK